MTKRNSDQSRKTYEFTSSSIHFSHHNALEDECHNLCGFGWRRSSTWSPDAWCRRFFIETAALKSDRSFIGPFLPALFRVIYQCPWYLFSSSGVRWYVWSSFASFVPFCALLFRPSDSELQFTINWISEISIVTTFEMFTLRVFHAFQAMWYSSYSSVLPCRAPWEDPFLIT